MRLNRFIASSTGLSRRAADEVVRKGRVIINGKVAEIGIEVRSSDTVQLDGKIIKPLARATIILHKPKDYVCSRAGQGNKTIYQLLPKDLQNLKPIGRLDKDSSGLLLMTSDGEMINELAHPSKKKKKIYEVKLDKPARESDLQRIESSGVKLDDGISRFAIKRAGDKLIVTLQEGRNRQIRRTFGALGYKVTGLHRKIFGDFVLNDLPEGNYASVTTSPAGDTR